MHDAVNFAVNLGYSAGIEGNIRTILIAGYSSLALCIISAVLICYCTLSSDFNGPFTSGLICGLKQFEMRKQSWFSSWMVRNFKTKQSLLEISNAF